VKGSQALVVQMEDFNMPVQVDEIRQSIYLCMPMYAYVYLCMPMYAFRQILHECGKLDFATDKWRRTEAALALGHPLKRPPSRVARWFLFKPKIPIWVNFGGP
jgi:hypothetical protein